MKIALAAIPASEKCGDLEKLFSESAGRFLATVAPDKAEAVLRAAREQGFTPRARRARAEGAGPVNFGFLPVAPLEVIGAEIFMRALKGLAESLPPRSGLVALPPFAGAEALQAAIGEQRLAGVLLAGFAAPHGLMAALGKTPCAWLWGRGESGKKTDEPAFGSDALAGALAARELLRQGAKRLVALAWPSCDPGVGCRVDGFRFEALRQGAAAQTLAPAPDTPAFETAPIAATRERLAALFETLDCDGAGIFSPDDRLTALLHPLLREWGLFPGRGARLMSCNHQKSLLAPLFPRPGSVDLAPELAARQALTRLRERLAGFAPPSRVEVVVRPGLVPGDPL
ncbi:MAG: hypothetical protein J6333_01835, partial [Planctomycetes bacterium]|nr:hypothetical protein [Planctomycetota bacterium]